MNTITCTVRFLCPAFLGDAQQQGAWRTPPFKAELRQWWRVLLAARGLSYPVIREHEATLFGNAWPDQTPCKSRVRLRLSSWDAGKLTNPAPTIGKITNGPNQVDGGLYLGYGAIAYDKTNKGTRLEHEPAIDASETAELRIGIRARHENTYDDTQDITSAIALMSRFGTVGGRSRNAWGSFVLEGDDVGAAETENVLRDWQDALAEEWACAIGHDEKGPLIWATEPKKDWQKAMQALARARSDLNRTFTDNQERALLSYPVTKKTLPEWGNNARLPNSLRFKIVPNGDRLQGMLFHMPCRPDSSLWNKHQYDAKELENLWRSVHKKLDDSSHLERVSG